MILKESFTKSWYDELNQNEKNLDYNLIDKVTHAFYLLEKLTDMPIKFIFKGGTCLLLLLKEMKRFSIDIDIIITEELSKEELFVALQEIIDDSLFIRVEEQVRYQKSIPKAHFKFFYISPLDNTESYVLLDILFEKSQYNKLLELPIVSPLLNTLPPNKSVVVPTIENILGDKLTAFAPNTTGIPYGKGKEMEIIKQLFDIENLFDQAHHLKEVKATFTKCAEQEITYRSLDLNVTNVLEDVFKTACIIGGRGSSEKETFLQLMDGIQRIKSHIISKNYILEEAVTSAAKAAYLASLLQTDQTEIEHFDPLHPLPEPIGTPLFKKMGKIKKFSPEAYYYFVKAQELRYLQ